LFKFTKSITKNKKVDLYNYGNHVRDFTYIDDIVNRIEKLLDKPPKGKIPNAIYNIGNGKPKRLKEFLKTIERILQKKAKINLKPLQMGDVHKTHASIKKIETKVKTKNKTNIELGIKKFIFWYKKFYKI